MNSFLLPPTPNFYKNDVAVCTPDNTYLYASVGDLVVIEPQSSNPRVLYKIHEDRITCVNINPEWSNPQKIVTTGLAKNVNVYDFNGWKPKTTNKAHENRDKLVLNSSLYPSCEILSAYQTIASQVNVFSPPSVLNPTQVAISANEESVQLLDFSSCNTKIVRMKTYKSEYNISGFTWYPTEENILLFSTFDGQIGRSDFGRTCTVSAHYTHKTRVPIVAMQWGPTVKNCDIFILYCIAADELFTVDPVHNSAYKLLLDSKTGVTQLAWKPDFKVCAVGDKFRQISFFNNKFVRLTTKVLQTKPIRSLVWHPHLIGLDLDISHCHFWLAAFSGNIVIYDLEQIKVAVKVVAELPVNGRNVLSMDWSPHENGKLVVLTDDALITVWNVITKEVITVINAEHSSTFNCVIWSPVHENYIITGGKGDTLRYWMVEETKLQPFESKNSDWKEFSKLWNPKAPKQKSSCVYVFSGQLHNKFDHFLMSKICQKLCDLRKSSELLDKRKSTGKIVEVLDSENFLKTDVYSQKSNLVPNRSSSWIGSIANRIIQAIQSDTLTIEHVNVASIVTPELWRITCEVHAKQLAKECANAAIESSSYFLACNKITEAIDVLYKNNKYALLKWTESLLDNLRFCLRLANQNNSEVMSTMPEVLKNVARKLSEIESAKDNLTSVKGRKSGAAHKCTSKRCKRLGLQKKRLKKSKIKVKEQLRREKK